MRAKPRASQGRLRGAPTVKRGHIDRVSPTGSGGQHSFERLVERLISAVDVEHTMRGALVVQQASQRGGDVITRDRASAGRRVQAYLPGAGVDWVVDKAATSIHRTSRTPCGSPAGTHRVRVES